MGRLSPRNRQIAHVLRTRSPVALASPRDLHVLSTPPAFVLSQDQTLQWIVRISSPRRCLQTQSKDKRPESMIVRELISPRCARAQRINESHNTTSHTRLSNSKKSSVPPIRGNAKYSQRNRVGKGCCARNSHEIHAHFHTTIRAEFSVATTRAREHKRKHTIARRRRRSTHRGSHTPTSTPSP